MGRIVGFVFFGIFFIAGLAAFYGAAYEPIRFWLENGYWRQSPSKIIFGCIFLLSHGGVGFAGLAYLFSKSDQSDDLSNFDRSSPWLDKVYWSSPAIQSDIIGVGSTLKKVAAYFAMVSLIVCFAIYHSIKRNEYEALYGLIIVGITALIYWGSLRATRSLNRFGPMLLDLDPYPASIGGQFGGTILVNGIVSNIKSSVVKVNCTHHYGSGSDTRKSSVWQEQMVPAWSLAASGSRLNFCFDLPMDAGLPQSQPSDSVPHHEWTLTVKVKLEDATTLERKYSNIPVFKTEQSSKIRNPEANASYSQATKKQHDAALDVLMPFKSEGNQTSSVYYPAGRNMWGVFLVVFGAVFVAVGLAIPDLLFNIIFPLLGGICALSGVYTVANSLAVSISPIGITTDRYLFGIKIKSQSLPSYDFKKFKKKETHSTQAKETTQYYSILAIGKEGQKLVVAENLNGQGQVKAAIARFEKMVSGW